MFFKDEQIKIYQRAQLNFSFFTENGENESRNPEGIQRAKEIIAWQQVL